MKILCLVSWEPKGRWLLDYVPGNQDQIDFLYVANLQDRYPGYGKVLGYYQRFWALGYQAWRKMGNYDLVITWEANTGLPIAFLRTLTRRRKPPLVILNFVLKGKPILDNLWLTRYAMRSVDHITCVSHREIEEYCRVLNYPTARCTRIQGPWHAYSFSEPPEVSGDYIFSAGRSHRDYGTLFKAVDGLQAPVIVNARDFNVRGLDRPANVTVNSLLPYPQFISLIQMAQIIVLPLHTARHASGETFLIQAMAAGKPVVATRTYSTAEIIEHGKNGMLVPPGDAQAMRSALTYCIEHPEHAREMGKQAQQDYRARWSFAVTASQVVDLLHQLAAA